jgi:AcrR family transcriptional regulator
MEDATTKERLLNAAEILFAEDGIQATTVRAIAVRAGQSNVSAVNYHFGSKEGLIHALLARNLMPLIARRLQLLTEYEATAQGLPVSVEAILYAYFAPAMDCYRLNPQSLRVTARLVSEPDAELHQLYGSFFDEMTTRFHSALRKSLPHLTEEEVFWRWHFVLGVGVHTWTNFRDVEVLSGGIYTLTVSQATVDRLVHFCAAGLMN